MMYCSIREPSDVARYFCSFTHAIDEFTKLTPFTPRAASLIFKSIAIFSSAGTSNGSSFNGAFPLRDDLRRRHQLDLLSR